MQTLWQDLRFAARTLRRNPTFAVIAVLTLGLGIGANSAIFSVVNGVILRALPYPESERLYKVSPINTQTANLGNYISPLNFLDWRSMNQSFEFLGGYMDDVRLNFSSASEPERITGAMVSDTLFPALATTPIIGRNFLAEEDRKGGARVALLSYQLWTGRFAQDSNIVGQSITLNAQPYTIVGVMPKDFSFPTESTQIWIPFGSAYEDGGRGNYFVEAIGRLKPEVTQEQAQAEMKTIAATLERQYPQVNTDTSIALTPLHDHVTGKIRPLLLALIGAVGMVLLIACSNVANLLLARAAGRQREVAIRAALGASRWRIIRQLLSESLLLALIGGLFGLLIAYWSVQALIALSPQDLPRMHEIGVDGRVIAFTLVVAVVTGLLFGLAPALQTSRTNLQGALKEGGRNVSPSSSWMRSGLVIAEVALSIILLIGAGLMIRSFWQVLAVQPGFTTQNILTFDISLPYQKYDRDKTKRFFQQALDRFGALPGIQSAGATSALPLSQANNRRIFTVESRVGNSPRDFTVENHRYVSRDYFSTLGIAISRGRPFADADFLPDSQPVVIINEAFASRHFPNQDALGKRMKMGQTADSPFAWMTVIGIIKDVKHTSLEDERKPEMYRPFMQLTSFENQREMTFAIRTTQPLESLLATLRQEVFSLDSDQPIANIASMQWLRDQSVARREFGLLLFATFAAVALLLACLGIYGVLSYTVAQHTREIGIRMALGAQTRDILKLIFGHGLLLTLTGIALGIGAALALTRFMASLLYEITATDSLTFLVVPLVLLLVALLACWLPARRALKVAPMEALRYE